MSRCGSVVDLVHRLFVELRAWFLGGSLGIHCDLPAVRSLHGHTARPVGRARKSTPMFFMSIVKR